MPATTEPPKTQDEQEPPLGVRLAWFLGIALASSGAVVAIAYALKAMLR
jgi:hypothetical protein